MPGFKLGLYYYLENKKSQLNKRKTIGIKWESNLKTTGNFSKLVLGSYIHDKVDYYYLKYNGYFHQNY